MTTATMCKLRTGVSYRGDLAPSREGVRFHGNDTYLVLEQVEDCEDEYNLTISNSNGKVFHVMSIDFSFFEFPVGKDIPITLDVDEWNTVVSALLRDGKLVTATIIIMKAFGYGVSEAIEYYKTFPAYQDYKVLWSRPTE